MRLTIEVLGVLGLVAIVLVSAYCVWEEVRKQK